MCGFAAINAVLQSSALRLRRFKSFVQKDVLQVSGRPGLCSLVALVLSRHAAWLLPSLVYFKCVLSLSRKQSTNAMAEYTLRSLWRHHPD